MVLALNVANMQMEEIERDMWQREEQKRRQLEEHDRQLCETAARLRFE